MALILFACSFVTGAILIYIYLSRRYSTSSYDPPGMKPQILFGNLKNSGLLAGTTTFHEVLTDYQYRYGDIFQFWLGPHQCIVFCLLEHAQTIFGERHTFEQSPLFLPNFDLLCPNSLLMLAGAKWKRHIRVMLPMFKRAKIRDQFDKIVRCADRFIDRNLQPGQIHRDLVMKCELFTMDVIGFIGFDYDFDVHVGSPIQTAFHDFIFYGTSLMMTPWMPKWLGRIYLRYNRKYQRAYRFIREFTEKLVVQEQKKQSKMKKQPPKNLLASMVSSLNEKADDEQVTSGLTYSEIFDEILLSILAGYETTSTVLAWFIFYASKNPRVQERIKDELREHNLLMTSHLEGVPLLTEDKLTPLIYCECVTKEVLRLAPASGFTTRVATHDTILDHVKIRRGQTIFIATHNINTDPRYWHHADPQQFVPERFLAEDQNHHPLAMIPFGGGHRACIGQDLVWLELKIIIVRLMQRGIIFEDTPENTGGYEELFTCVPKHFAVRINFDSPGN